MGQVYSINSIKANYLIIVKAYIMIKATEAGRR
jgi:hypothetical protein